MMDFNKLQQLLDLSKQFEVDQFWKQAFQTNMSELTSQLTNHSLKDNLAHPLSGSGHFPLIDMYETDLLIVIEAELPGLDQHDIQLSIENNRLFINGEYKTFIAGIHYHLKERPNRKFEKSIHLPATVNEDQIETKFVNGILYIKCPITKNSTYYSVSNNENDDQ